MPATTHITLTLADDTYTSAAGNYIVNGLSGNDTITTGAGDSSVFTGFGNSTITTGAGASTVVTGDGNQTITTGAGNSHVTTGIGNSTITTGAGMNVVVAGDGNNTVTLGAGDSSVTTGNGNQTITAGAGNDMINVGIGNSLVTAAAGNDVLIYHAAGNQSTTSTFDGGTGIDTLRLVLTRAEWMSNTVQSDIANYLRFLSAHTGTSGDADTAAFKFTAFGLSASSIEKLQVTVDGVPIDPANHPVTLGNDIMATTEKVASLAADVLANDSVSDLIKSFTYTNPAHGSLQLAAVYTDTASVPTAKFTYTPTAGFYDYLAQGETATDAFSYTVIDATGDVKTASVTVTITGTNDAPVITSSHLMGAVTQMAAVPDNTALTSMGAINFSDIDLSDVHSISAVTAGDDGALGTLTASVSNDTGHTTGQDGIVTWDYQVSNSAVEYLAAGQTKVETFSFNVLDGHGGSVPSTVSVTITGVNDAATFAGSDTAAVTEDHQLVANGTLTVSDVDQGQSSMKAIDGQHGVYGNFSVQTNGNWSYMLNNGAASVQSLRLGDHVVDSFIVNSFDGTAHQINITVNGTNHGPTISASAPSNLLVEKGTGVAGVSTSVIHLTTADVDGAVSYDTTGWTKISESTFQKTGVYGAVTLDTTDNSLTYLLDNTNVATKALNTGTTVHDSFNIGVLDAYGSTANASVSFDIQGTTNTADGLTGPSISYQYIFPTLGEVIFETDIEAGTTLTGFYGSNSYPSATIAFTDSQIIIDFQESTSWTNSSFNGFHISNPLHNFSSVTLDASSNMEGLSQANITYDAHDIYVNWHGLTFIGGVTHVALDMIFA